MLSQSGEKRQRKHTFPLISFLDNNKYVCSSAQADGNGKVESYVTMPLAIHTLYVRLTKTEHSILTRKIHEDEDLCVSTVLGLAAHYTWGFRFPKLGRYNILKVLHRLQPTRQTCTSTCAYTRIPSKTKNVGQWVILPLSYPVIFVSWLLTFTPRTHFLHTWKGENGQTISCFS